MGRMPKQPTLPVSGAHVGIFAYLENADGTTSLTAANMVGRGSSFNFDENFSVIPVQEIGLASPEELSYGAGQPVSFTIGKYWGVNMNAEKYLPNLDENRETHLELNDLSLVLMAKHGKYKGKVLGTIRHAKIQAKSGQLNPTSLFQGSMRGQGVFFNLNDELVNMETTPSVDELPTAAE